MEQQGKSCQKYMMEMAKVEAGGVLQVLPAAPRCVLQHPPNPLCQIIADVLQPVKLSQNAYFYSDCLISCSPTRAPPRSHRTRRFVAEKCMALTRPRLGMKEPYGATPPSPSSLPLLPRVILRGDKPIGRDRGRALTCFTCRSTTVWKTCATNKETLAMSSVRAKTPTVTRHSDLMAAADETNTAVSTAAARLRARRKGRAAASPRPPRGRELRQRSHPPRRAPREGGREGESRWRGQLRRGRGPPVCFGGALRGLVVGSCWNLPACSGRLLMQQACVKGLLRNEWKNNYSLEENL